MESLSLFDQSFLKRDFAPTFQFEQELNNSKECIPFFEYLPNQVLLMILENLEPINIISVSMCCKSALNFVRREVRKLDWTQRSSRKSIKFSLNHMNSLAESKNSINSKIKFLSKLHNKSKNSSNLEFTLALSVAPNLQELSIKNCENFSQFNFWMLSRCSQLRYLSLENIRSDQVVSLLLALWNLNNLVELNLSFNPNFSDRPTFFWSSFSSLTKLKKLSLSNMPPSWNSAQSVVFNYCTQLEVLDISYIAGNDITTTGLSNLKNLRELTLQFPLDGLIPIQLSSNQSKLRVFRVLNGFVSSSQLEKCESLEVIEITPWGWKKSDLEVFGKLNNLKSLIIRANWLPPASDIYRLFGRLETLHLIELDISCCQNLTVLNNLSCLSIEAPCLQKSTRLVNGSQLSNLLEMLKEMNSLKAFALTQSPHITVELAQVLEKHCPNLTHLKLDACKNCLNHLFRENINAYQRIQALFIHTDTFEWEYLSKFPQLRLVSVEFTGDFSYKDLQSIPWRETKVLEKVKAGNIVINRPVVQRKRQRS